MKRENAEGAAVARLPDREDRPGMAADWMKHAPISRGPPIFNPEPRNLDEVPEIA